MLDKLCQEKSNYPVRDYPMAYGKLSILQTRPRQFKSTNYGILNYEQKTAVGRPIGLLFLGFACEGESSRSMIHRLESTRAASGSVRLRQKPRPFLGRASSRKKT